MKICVFSDIHGNGPAFEQAYPHILAEKADLNIFLGDLCGYYFDQMSVLDQIKTIPRLIAIKGNHDAMFFQIYKGDDRLRENYKQKYGLSMEHLLAQEHLDCINWINTLSEAHTINELDISCYHGCPWEPLNGYVYPNSDLNRFSDYNSSLFLLGHTHYPMVRKIEDKIVINPGSLGQPRQGGKATYAIIEYPPKEVCFREIQYDLHVLFSRIDAIGDLNPYLKNVLLRKNK